MNTNLALHNNHSFQIPQIPHIKENSHKAFTIAKIAARTFLHLSLAIAVNFAVITFVAAPLSITLMTGIVLSTIATEIIYCAYEIYKRKNMVDNIQKSAQISSGIATASIINAVGLSGPNILIHETGHALAAHATFQAAMPEISIAPFRGGATTYVISNGLTKLGKFLGRHEALLIVTAAGMAASTLFALFEFAIADRIKEVYPVISEYLTDHAIFQLLNEILYGLTAFIVSRAELSHDFICLWQCGGIHPLIPITFMIALPLLEIAVLKLIKNRCCSQKINDFISPPCTFH